MNWDLVHFTMEAGIVLWCVLIHLKLSDVEEVLDPHVRAED